MHATAATQALVERMYELDIPRLTDHLAAGHDLNTPLAHGRRLLHHVAAERPTNPIFAWLLDHGADPNVASDDGQTPLHWGCDCLDAVEVLLVAGADPNAVDARGWSALHFACWGCTASGAPVPLNRVTSVVRTLLAAGADPKRETTKSRSNRGDTPVPAGSRPAHAALAREHRAALRLLHAHAEALVDRDGNTLLHRAAANKSVGQAGLIGFLLDELGVDINAVNSTGWTALHYACWELANVDFIEELVRRGAHRAVASTRAHKRLPSGATPLDVAKQASNFQPDGTLEFYRDGRFVFTSAAQLLAG